MDFVVPSICLSSIAGAVLFYTGGRLHPRPAPPRPPVRLEVEVERAARRRAEEETAGALRATREAVGALAEERSRSTALREALAAERDARAREGAEAARERQRLVEAAARPAPRKPPSADAGAAERRVAELGAELEKARLEAGRARVEVSQARAETERATAAARRLSAEAATLRAKAAEQARAAAEIEGGRARVALAEARAADAETRAARAEATAAEAEARAGGAEGLREENRRLQHTVTALERERVAAPDLAEVQRRTLSATMAIRTLEQRSAEVARREAENADLRRRVDALATAAAEAETLRRQVRDLTALGFARTARGPAPADDDEGPTSEDLESSLVQGLRELCQAEPGCRTAVLSDMRGLLIAAFGEGSYRLELAAAAALTTTTAQRLRELLPLGEPVAFTLADESEIVFQTRWLRWEDDAFLLSTLGHAAAEGAGPGAAPAAGDAPSERLRQRLAALLGRT